MPEYSKDSGIKQMPFEGEMVDVMGGNSRIEARVLDHGFVALIDVMPRFVPEGKTADYAIPQAARVSYGQGTRQVSEDEGLINYLMRHRHTTPFEMVETKWHCRMPIISARQWIRHRTASVNEMSGRYSIMPGDFYHPNPENVRKQSTTNRQGGDESADLQTAQEFLAYLDRAEALYGDYLELEKRGVSRELARMGLPVSIYTEWYWKIDLHNLFHFLGLRMDSHAQKEIRDYAYAMYRILEPIVPISAKAFRKYQLEATKMSSLDMLALGRVIKGEDRNVVAEQVFPNKREREEFIQKTDPIVPNLPSSS